MLAILFSPIAAHAQSLQPDPTVCYAIADNQGNLPSGIKADNNDELVQINRSTAATTAIGATGTTNIEAMTFVMRGGLNTLYAADGGTIGTVNLATGGFTAIGPAGSGAGSVGTVKFNDLDGLAYDPSENVIYASHRVDNSNDLLLKIDVVTGARIANAFGAGKDYLIVPAPSGHPTWQNVDDLSFDPTTGKLYATLNDSGEGGLLVILNKATAALTEIGTYNDLNEPGNFVDDIEGISFFNDGNLFASTGNNGPDKKDINKLWWINKQTGAASLIGPFPTSFTDYEALGCLTQSASLTLKKFTNGEDADTPPGPTVPVGSPIVWTYIVTNTGAVALTNLSLTDDKLGPITCIEGAIPNLAPNQSFSCSVNGIATTVGQYANIGTVNGTWTNPNGSFVITDTDPSHYFGAQAAITLQKTVYAGHNAGVSCPGGELVTGKLGDAITYCFVVTNTGNTYLKPVALDDLTLGINRANLTLLSGTEPLAPNASLTFYYETTLSKGLLNTATTTGTPSNSGGVPIPGLPNVTAQDTAQVAVVGSIGDTVFIDANNNNTFDTGEGVSGITVVLTLPGNTTLTTVTTGDGFYLFDNLPAGAYVVTVQTAGTPLAGLVNHVDPDGGNNSTSSLTLGAGENNLLQDFGYQEPLAQPGSIGDFVWQDTNGNGLQDVGEPGIPNVTVILTASNGVTKTTVTNANGIYGFINLPADTYTVRVDATTLPAGFQQTFDLDGIHTPNSAVAPLAAGEDRTDVDFGYQPGQQALLGS
ncbi:MAG: carboxypeptidase regulatory-like domain-containing protein, partial [Chloroflexi bacterium]|nr:carboxypeptidase regulatory-like domain-containing protein [Chloroflexota bacterium]